MYATRSARSVLHGVHVCNEVRTLCLLLHAGKHHLGAGHVLLRVDQILEEVLVRPDDAGVLVRLGEGKAIIATGQAAHDTPERRALLRVAPLLDRVALSALRLE